MRRTAVTSGRLLERILQENLHHGNALLPVDLSYPPLTDFQDAILDAPTRIGFGVSERILIGGAAQADGTISPPGT